LLGFSPHLEDVGHPAIFCSSSGLAIVDFLLVDLTPFWSSWGAHYYWISCSQIILPIRSVQFSASSRLLVVKEFFGWYLVVPGAEPHRSKSSIKWFSRLVQLCSPMNISEQNRSELHFFKIKIEI